MWRFAQADVAAGVSVLHGCRVAAAIPAEALSVHAKAQMEDDREQTRSRGPIFFTKLSRFLQAAVNVSKLHSIHIRADSYGMVVSARHTRCCDQAEITMTLAFLPFGMATAAEEI